MAMGTLVLIANISFMPVWAVYVILKIVRLP